MKLSLALGLASFTLIPPAFGGDFEQGCALYQSKNYAGARLSFEKAAKTFPKNWLVHYYLANTCLSLNQKAVAKAEYEQCLACKPNSATAKYCQDIILKLGGSAAAPPTADPSIATDSSNKEAGDKGATASTDKEPGKETKPSAAVEAKGRIAEENESKASDLLAKAQAECTAIRVEAREKIANGRKTGNQWYIGHDGSQYPDLASEEKDAINHEAEERCNRIMDLAERSAARLRGK